jgi:hypothetical protein
MDIKQERPPLIWFGEQEYGIDPDASDKAGYPVPRIALMIFVTSHGSKDCFTAPAESWIEQKHKDAAAGRYNPEWVKMYRAALKEYKAGNELPRDGVPVKTWQMLTSEQRARAIAAKYTTVEDLAAIPDSGLAELGLDGRYIRDTAKAWIAEGKDKGANARALADALAENERLRERADDLTHRIEVLEAVQSQDNEPRRGPGRPRKTADATA